MRITPTNRRLCVKLDEALGVTESGIHIPESAQKDTVTGEVLAVGPGEWQNGTFVPCTLKTGDRVVVGKYGGSKVEIGGVEYLFINESEVYAVLEDEEGA